VGRVKTLVLDLEDVLVHRDWSRAKGWQIYRWAAARRRGAGGCSVWGSLSLLALGRAAAAAGGAGGADRGRRRRAAPPPRPSPRPAAPAPLTPSCRPTHTWPPPRRPGARDFISQLGQYYEVVIYTDEQAMYADPIVNALDPQRAVQYRLYRQDTQYADGKHVRDLSKLNRDMRHVLFVSGAGGGGGCPVHAGARGAWGWAGVTSGVERAACRGSAGGQRPAPSAHPPARPPAPTRRPLTRRPLTPAPCPPPCPPANPDAYAFQPENTLKLKKWEPEKPGDAKDTTLLDLIPFLQVGGAAAGAGARPGPARAAAPQVPAPTPSRFALVTLPLLPPSSDHPPPQMVAERVPDVRDVVRAYDGEDDVAKAFKERMAHIAHPPRRSLLGGGR
jgi:hypothetical protein